MNISFRHSLPFGACHMSPRPSELHHCMYVLFYFKCLLLAYPIPSWNSEQLQAARANTSSLYLGNTHLCTDPQPWQALSCTLSRPPQARPAPKMIRPSQRSPAQGWPSACNCSSPLIFLILQRTLLFSSRLKKKATKKANSCRNNQTNN